MSSPTKEIENEKLRKIEEKKRLKNPPENQKIPIEESPAIKAKEEIKKEKEIPKSKPEPPVEQTKKRSRERSNERKIDSEIKGLDNS